MEGVFNMKNKKQEELVNAYISRLNDDIKPLYGELTTYLSELGYNPKKEKSSISFKHDKHNKQIAKMGMNTSKKKGEQPFFALRFSACRGYSQRFEDIVAAYITKYSTRTARCISGGCDFCAGEPETHVYTYICPNGEKKTHCGAYGVEIPNIKAEDIQEIKKLLKEEHEYLYEHEVPNKN
jgi:hypothetical protein